MDLKRKMPDGPIKLTQDQLDRIIERHVMFRTGKHVPSPA